MSIPFSAELLKQNIDHDTSVCESLLSILKEEQEALKKREVDQVNSLLDQKVPLLERLEASAQVRQAWAQSANSPNDENGWAKIIVDIGASDVKADWQHLKTLYADVRTQNEVNGKLLSRHQGTVKKMLDIMRGTTASPNLYNASGYSSSQAQTNKFGEA